MASTVNSFLLLLYLPWIHNTPHNVDRNRHWQSTGVWHLGTNQHNITVFFFFLYPSRTQFWQFSSRSRLKDLEDRRRCRALDLSITAKSNYQTCWALPCPFAPSALLPMKTNLYLKSTTESIRPLVAITVSFPELELRRTIQVAAICGSHLGMLRCCQSGACRRIPISNLMMWRAVGFFCNIIMRMKKTNPRRPLCPPMTWERHVSYCHFSCLL